MPTILDILDVPHEADGMSAWPLVTGKLGSLRERIVIGWAGWADGNAVGRASVHTTRWNYVVSVGEEDSAPELYDTQADVGSRTIGWTAALKKLKWLPSIWSSIILSFACLPSGREGLTNLPDGRQVNIKLHANAATTPRIRKYIPVCVAHATGRQESTKTVAQLARELGLPVADRSGRDHRATMETTKRHACLWQTGTIVPAVHTVCALRCLPPKRPL